MSTAKPFTLPKETVRKAWNLVKKNDGGSGIDQQTIEAFELDLKDNLYKIWNRMSSGTYFPPPVRGVDIPKKQGGVRTLGIPTVSDRIAQMVVRLHFEPVVEPVFHDNSYGYRPNRSAHDAIRITRTRCWRHKWVLEFDIKGLFDNIPHDLLMKAVRHHTDNPWVILYIGRWLTAPMERDDKTQIAGIIGVPQGGVVSPVLSNLFMHYAFDKWMAREFPQLSWCRYADDGLVHCDTAAQAKQVKASLTVRLTECGLEIHPEKTRIVNCVPTRKREGDHHRTFTFLGYTFQPLPAKNRKTGKIFQSFLPAISQKARKSIQEKVKAEWRLRSKLHLSIAEVASATNSQVRGWFNYYGKFYPTMLQGIARYINDCLMRWLIRKYKRIDSKATAWKVMCKIFRDTPKLFAHWEWFPVR